MKSYNQSRDGSNLIKTISDYYWSHIPQNWLSHQSPDLPNQPSNFRINFSNQLFKSTYVINLLIDLAAPLAYGTLLLLTNIRTWESAPTYWGTYDSGSWPSCRSPTCQGVKRITLKHLLVAIWMQALLDTARTSLICRCQLCLQENQNDENDKNFLVVDQWSPGLTST